MCYYYICLMAEWLQHRAEWYICPSEMGSKPSRAKAREMPLAYVKKIYVWYVYVYDVYVYVYDMYASVLWIRIKVYYSY